ncbi:HlyD family secretion protein [Pantoea vagans]|uniref:HlyD family secretion protein n=1 Tax=Pantoea vagans TaxID=470934 RepID=UPI003B0172A1
MFRKEAIEHYRDTWQGQALLLPGIPLSWIIIVTSFFVTGIIAFITFCSYTHRISVDGEIITTPRAVNVLSAQQGFIISALANAGDTVKEGQPLLKIDVSRTTLSGRVSENQQREIHHQIASIDQIILSLEQNKHVTIDALKQQKDRYDNAYGLSTDIVNKARKGIALMQNNMENYNKWRKKGLINNDQFLNQAALYYQQQNNLLTLYSQNQQNALESTRIASQIQTQSADFDTQIWQMKIQRNALKRELSSADASGIIIVTAPTGGRIDSFSASTGQMVNPGDSLLQIVPQKIQGHQLIMWVPNTALPWLAPGDPVNIRYQAFPMEKFGQFRGTVSFVAETPASRQEILEYSSAPLADNQRGESWYKVLVKPEQEAIIWQNKSLALENGMKATGTLFLETRRIYQWMATPFYDMKNSARGPLND